MTKIVFSLLNKTPEILENLVFSSETFISVKLVAFTKILFPNSFVANSSSLGILFPIHLMFLPNLIVTTLEKLAKSLESINIVTGMLSIVSGISILAL